MLCKYYLHIGSTKVDISDADCMDVGDMIANLSDLVIRFQRMDYGGVVRSCGSEIEFIDDAKESLVALWNSSYVQSKASFAVYAINERWVYEPLWECPLDFSTFRYDDHRATIGCVDTSAAALIKANRGTRYHFGAVGLSEEAKLDYDRITIANRYKAQMMGTEVSGSDTYTQMVNDSRNDYYSLVLALARLDEQVSSQNSLLLNSDFNASEFRNDVGGSDQYYFKALKDCEVNLDFTQFRIWGTKEVRVLDYDTREYVEVGTNRLELWYVLHQFDESDMAGTLDLLAESDLEKTDDELGYVYPCGIRGKFHVRAGYSVCLMVYGKIYADEHEPWLRQKHTFGPGTVLYLGKGSGEVEWDSRSYNIDMRVVKPITLLNKLLERIGGDRMQLRGAINDDGDERLRNTMLLPAEEIRGFSGPTLYSSFKQFCEMMESVFGYVYTIEDAEVENTLELSVIDFDEYYGSMPSGGVIVTGSLATVAQKVCYFAAEGRFYGVSEVNGTTYYYHLWRGCADYIDYANKYAPLQKKVYFCVGTYVPYHYPGGIGGLELYYLDEIDTRYYDRIRGFSEIHQDYVQDSRHYDGQVTGSDIVFVPYLSMFFCKDQAGNFYSSWEGSEDYNDVMSPRERTVFEALGADGIYYVCYDERYLIPYREQDLELDTMMDAAIVRFVHRRDLFSSEEQALSPIAGPEVKVDGERLVSEVRIGYEKKDYDLGNSGNDEWNFTNIYTTDSKLREKALELICPYRADCYGIEELAGKRNIETSSTDSDSDIFLVKIKEPDMGSDQWTGKYLLDRSISVEGAYTDTVFNATYAPYFCIRANREYIGSFTQRLLFASAQGNRGIAFIANGTRYSMQLSVVIHPSNRLFGVCDFVVRTSEQREAVVWDALVSFKWRDSLYRGYVKSVTFNPQHPEEVEYELLGKTP